MMLELKINQRIMKSSTLWLILLISVPIVQSAVKKGRGTAEVLKLFKKTKTETTQQINEVEEPVTVQYMPHQVCIYDLEKTIICGGSIVNRNAVLTAAHCVYGKPSASLLIRFNSIGCFEGGETLRVTRTYIHPQFNITSLDGNLAILRVPNIKSDNVIQIKPIDVGRKGPVRGAQALGVSWGTLASNQANPSNSLLYSGLLIKRRGYCASADDNLSNSMLCAVDVTSNECIEGEGGGLIVQKRLVGVKSWSSCTKPITALFTKTAKYFKWIKKTLRRVLVHFKTKPASKRTPMFD